MNRKTAATALLPIALLLCTLAAAPARAQGESAQQRYEREIAACNGGSLPAPQRDACVRAAGTALDAARGSMVPAETTRATPDGRATVVTPPGARTPATGSDVTTSPDGRATIVPSSDRSGTPR